MYTLGKGSGHVALAVAALVLFVSTSAFAIPLDPSGGYIWIDDSITFNIAQGQLVFDNTGTAPVTGNLKSLDGAPGSGVVSSLNPNYPGPYTFGLVIDIPITSDLSAGGTANGWFGSDVNYALIDMENGNAVLLSGQLVGGFGLHENYNNQLQTYGGDGPYNGILMTITGGSLAPYFAPQGEMYFEYWVSVPSNMQNFSTDLISGGGGSVTIYGVPEPVSLLTLACGGLVAAIIRRRSRLY